MDADAALFPLCVCVCAYVCFFFFFIEQGTSIDRSDTCGMPAWKDFSKLVNDLEFTWENGPEKTFWQLNAKFLASIREASLCLEVITVYFIYCCSFITWAQHQPQRLHTMDGRRERKRVGRDREREREKESSSLHEHSLKCVQETVKQQVSITPLLSRFSFWKPLSFASAGLKPDENKNNTGQK